MSPNLVIRKPGLSVLPAGEAVGSSGSCATQGLPPAHVTGLHAVLWEKDRTPKYLGTLGDAKNTMFNAAASINNLGEVVGTSQYVDGSIHSFLWTKRSMPTAQLPSTGRTTSSPTSTSSSPTRRCIVPLFPNPHLLERPDLVDPALDFEGFRGRVFGGLLKQPRCACERRSERHAAL